MLGHPSTPQKVLLAGKLVFPSAYWLVALSVTSLRPQYTDTNSRGQSTSGYSPKPKKYSFSEGAGAITGTGTYEPSSATTSAEASSVESAEASSVLEASAELSSVTVTST